MTDATDLADGPDPDVADYAERRAVLLREYTDAIIAAQTSHSPWDWIVAGSAFKKYAEAAVIAAAARAEEPKMPPNEEDDVIVPQQDVVSVYTNPQDAVVIQQFIGDEDHFVYIHRIYLPALIKKLQSYLPEGGA